MILAPRSSSALIKKERTRKPPLTTVDYLRSGIHLFSNSSQLHHKKPFSCFSHLITKSIMTTAAVSNKYHKVVSFRDEDEAIPVEPVEDALVADLYYSKDEIRHFRRIDKSKEECKIKQEKPAATNCRFPVRFGNKTDIETRLQQFESAMMTLNGPDNNPGYPFTSDASRSQVLNMTAAQFHSVSKIYK